MSEPFELLTCPYNMAHQIQRYRMQFHLEKCRKQNKGGKEVTCPFDARHIVKEAELEYHVSICPKRDMFDRQRYVEEEPSNVYKPLAKDATVDESEENWDLLTDTSYKPPESSNPHIIKKIKGATPSERRKARMEGVQNYKPT